MCRKKGVVFKRLCDDVCRGDGLFSEDYMLLSVQRTGYAFRGLYVDMCAEEKVCLKRIISQCVLRVS